MNERLKKLVSNANLIEIISQDFDLDDGRNYSKGLIHDSLVVDKRKNRFYWNSLGVSGNALDWLLTVKGLTENEAVKFLEMYQFGGLETHYDVPVGPPSIYSKLLDVFFELGRNNRDYWYSRGFSDKTIDTFKLGFTGKCYVVPIILEGQLYNFQCRTPEKRMWSWSRTTGALPFNFDVLKETRNILITESPVNSIALYQYGYSSISQTGGAGTWKKWWSSYLVNQTELDFIYDNDLAGLTGELRVAKLYKDRSQIFVWPEGTPPKYDPNDWLINGLTKPKVIKLLMERLFPYEIVKSHRVCLWKLG